MNAPPVQYVRTSDGYDIAYTDTGNGVPFVFMPATAASHVQLSRDLPSAGSWLAPLSGAFRLIHYDSRGQGLSTRGLTPDFAMKDYELDLESVVNRPGLERFVLFGTGYFGHVAVRFAVRHPERIQALILLNSSASMKAWPMSVYRDLARENWELFLRNISPARTWGATEREAAVDLFRQMVNQEDHLIAAEAFSTSDIFGLLSQLKVPTLILAGRDFSHLDSAEASRLASRISGAQLKLLNGSALFADAAEGVPEVENFLRTLPERTSSLGPGGASGFAAQLSARELEILRLLAQGKSNPQIAEELFITRSTVQNHVSNILIKTNAANRTEAAVYAKEHGIA